MARARGSYAWFIPILIGLGIAASSIFDSNNDEPQTVTINGVVYENVIPDTVKTCSDYQVGEAPADCISSQEIMDRDPGDFSWGRLAAGAILLAVGLMGLTGQFGLVTDLFKRDEDVPTGRGPVHLLTPLLLQDTAGVDTCDGWITCHPIATVVVAVVVVGIFLAVAGRNKKAG